jgi:hypothetical protein
MKDCMTPPLDKVILRIEIMQSIKTAIYDILRVDRQKFHKNSSAYCQRGASEMRLFKILNTQLCLLANCLFAVTQHITI